MLDGRLNYKMSRKDIKIIDDEEFELNIQPEASILNVFSRLSYKPWYAIAEFVDNSTQSYLTNMEVLNADRNFDRLVVKVKYDTNSNTLVVTDNAYGMEIDKFMDAILLDAKNETQEGRNEFGMGLKTAASWFGNVWTVTSTQFGSSNQYSATVDIPLLKREGLNSIKIHKTSAKPREHGTTIVISDITKKINASKTVAKIKDLLSSMYRRDINKRNIEIWFNDEPIAFEDYPVLRNFRGREWKKDLDFKVDFDNKRFHVTGFVAIMDPGSFLKAGFALFRQDRVVIGGTDSNYKPSQIFGQLQSQRSLKLFGELNMNDFPVNQAKDGFVWDDGLEDAFIEELKSNIQEFLVIADLSIKERAQETQFSSETSTEVHKEVELVIDNLNEENQVTCTSSTSLDIGKADDGEISLTQEYIDTILNQKDTIQQKLVGTPRTYNIPINQMTKRKIIVNWALGKNDFWIEYKDEVDGTIDVIINIDHPFFKPYSNEEKFKIVLEKFVLAFIIAEQQARSTSDKQGYILASTIKNYMNSYLSKMGD